MIARQTVAAPNTLSAMTIVHNLSLPLAERAARRTLCGPMMRYRVDASRSKGVDFYMDDSGTGMTSSPIDLRLQWADEHTSAGISHNGWYIDEDQHETVRGVVARLPSGRGFLAGWCMGEGMCGALEHTVHADEREAAMMADEHARVMADHELSYRFDDDDDYDDSDD